MKLFVVCLFLFLLNPMYAEVIDLTGIIDAHASIRAASFSLIEGQHVVITKVGPTQASFDAYVYSSETHELFAKSDDDEDEAFTWTVRQPSRYYVIVRNSGSVSARYQISISDPARSLSAGQPTAAVVKVFYATDRVRERGNKGLAYGTELAPELELGVCEVSIPRSHQMGELEGPSIWRLEFQHDSNKHVVLSNIVPEDSASFFGQISKRINSSTSREALVFVYGFNTDFETGVRRSAQISYDLGFEGAAVLYSWPSQGHFGLVDYNKDVRNAELSVQHFSEFVANLSVRTGVRRIHVIAHSMGSRLVIRAVAAAQSTKQPKLRQLALLAPDFDAEEFRRLSSAMKRSADHVTLYVSSRDEALKVSERLAGYPRAGEGEPHIVVLPGIDTVDASAVDTSLLGFNHSYFGDNQTILSDLFYLLRDARPDQRVRLRARQSSAGTYWAFIPAVR